MTAKQSHHLYTTVREDYNTTLNELVKLLRGWHPLHEQMLLHQKQATKLNTMQACINRLGYESFFDDFMIRSSRSEAMAESHENALRRQTQSIITKVERLYTISSLGIALDTDVDWNWYATLAELSTDDNRTELLAIKEEVDHWAATSGFKEWLATKPAIYSGYLECMQ